MNNNSKAIEIISDVINHLNESKDELIEGGNYWIHFIILIV